MKRIIRLTEQDLVKLVKRVINEATEGLDDFIEQLKSKFDLSDELVDEIKLIFEKANCKKVSIENIKPMGMASDEILIISTRLFNSNKIKALFIIFHELGHSYQFKKYGAEKMGDFFINDISLDDAALALSQYEAVADEFAKRKLRELKNKGLIDFENLGSMGSGNPSPGQFKGMLQFYRNEFKKLGIKDGKKGGEYMYNLAKIN